MRVGGWAAVAGTLVCELVTVSRACLRALLQGGRGGAVLCSEEGGKQALHAFIHA